ncbi:MAG: hypothetical protein JSU96_09660, partial [Acidobacteriota bacterium]
GVGFPRAQLRAQCALIEVSGKEVKLPKSTLRRGFELARPAGFFTPLRFAQVKAANLRPTD